MSEGGEDRHNPYWMRRLVLLLIVVVILFSIYVVRNTLTPLFISMLIAYLLMPMTDFLENRGMGRIFSITVTFFSFFGFLILVILYLIPLINHEIVGLTTGLPKQLATLDMKIGQIQERLAQSWPAIQELDVSLRLQKAIIDKLKTVPTYVANMFSLFPLLILVPLISFFFLKDGKRIKRSFLGRIPNRYFEAVVGLLHEIDIKIGRYIRGQLLRSTVIGILTYLGLRFFGLKYSLLLAVFAGVMNLIPYAGPFIASLPSLFFALLNQANPDAVFYALSPLPLVANIALIYLLVQTLDAIWIAPYIIGWSVDIHPLGIVLLLLFGNQLFGWWGIILAVPVASIAKLIVEAVQARYSVWQS